MFYKIKDFFVTSNQHFMHNHAQGVEYVLFKGKKSILLSALKYYYSSTVTKLSRHFNLA